MMKKLLFMCLLLSVALCSRAQYSERATTLIDRAAYDDGEAEWELAMMYLTGDGVPRHYYLATHWLSQAFVHGQAERVREFYRSISRSQQSDPYYSYLHYMKGMVYWLNTEDPNMGAFCFSRASLGGLIPEAQALYYISYANFLKTVPGAEKEVRKLVKRRREMAYEDPQLLTMEATALYERGDTATAISLWKRASAAGMPLADDRLGEAYLTAKGRFYGENQATHHFRRADRMKMLTNHDLYALCYRYGLGSLPKDSVKADRIEARESESMRWTNLLDVIHEEDLLLTAPLR